MLAVVWLFGSANALAAKFKIANGDIATLLAAVETASTNNQPDTIYLAYKGVYTFTVAVMDGTPFKAAIVFKEDHNNPLHTVVVFGNGATLQRNVNADAFRVLGIIGTVELNDVYLKNGKITLDNGAGIFNAGWLYLNRCTITSEGESCSK